MKEFLLEGLIFPFYVLGWTFGTIANACTFIRVSFVAGYRFALKKTEA